MNPCMSKVELETSISDGREGKDARPGGLDRAMERRERAVRGLKVQDIIMEPDSSEG